jgi:urate oxidase
MYREKCECCSIDDNYIVWNYNEELGGIFIIHIGGSNKRQLYRMGHILLGTVFKGHDIYFQTQALEYWRNHMVPVATTVSGIQIYKYKEN